MGVSFRLASFRLANVFDPSLSALTPRGALLLHEALLKATTGIPAVWAIRNCHGGRKSQLLLYYQTLIDLHRYDAINWARDVLDRWPAEPRGPVKLIWRDPEFQIWYDEDSGDYRVVFICEGNPFGALVLKGWLTTHKRMLIRLAYVFGLWAGVDLIAEGLSFPDTARDYMTNEEFVGFHPVVFYSIVWNLELGTAWILVDMQLTPAQLMKAAATDSFKELGIGKRLLQMEITDSIRRYQSLAGQDDYARNPEFEGLYPVQFYLSQWHLPGQIAVRLARLQLLPSEIIQRLHAESLQRIRGIGPITQMHLRQSVMVQQLLSALQFVCSQ